MPERSSYQEGVPCWVDLQATDVDKAKEFYSGLFGWDFEELDGGDGMKYNLARINGKDVAGIGSVPPGGEGRPSVWNTYLASNNVDDTAAKVTEAGGNNIMLPVGTGSGSGRMFFATDSTGAMVGFWEAGTRIGAQLVNEPGTLVWNELSSDDPEKSGVFYTVVVGLGVKKEPAGDLMEYWTFQSGSDPVGGMTRREQSDQPNAWVTYFCVDDVNGAVSKAESLGATITIPAFDVPTVGRMAGIVDPVQGFFMVMDMNEEGEEGLGGKEEALEA
ncbi:VOC family protein [Haematomicrobium sanguinis]|uniref:VOC family protein n=1 Tax=Haematomicrobium sanguinis TaxID=479106 RepID=UPI00068FB459|nr:VOC family protein [Haematomicrobium sanguinis]